MGLAPMKWVIVGAPSVIRRTMILKHTIGIGHPFMLAQMFQPRFDKECFEKSSLLCGVLEYTPGISAIAAAFMFQLVHGGEEYLAILRLYSIFDGHENRSLIIFDLVADDWRGPVHGRREIKPAAGLQLPAPRQGNCDKRTGRSDEMRQGQSGQERDLSPEHTADCHRSKKYRNKHRKSAAANPIRQRNLRRHIEARQHGDP